MAAVNPGNGDGVAAAVANDSHGSSGISNGGSVKELEARLD